MKWNRIVLLAVLGSCPSYDLLSVISVSTYLVYFFLQDFCLCKQIRRESLSLSETSHYIATKQFTSALMKIQFSIGHLILVKEIIYFNTLYHMKNMGKCVKITFHTSWWNLQNSKSSTEFFTKFFKVPLISSAHF